MKQERKKETQKCMGRHMLLLVLFLLCAPLLFTPSKSFAALGDSCCSCHSEIDRKSSEEWGKTYREITQHIDREFTAHRRWFVTILWDQNLLQALMMMGEQLSAVAMQQTQIVGSFMDAQHQLETQRTLGTMRAQAHKDYHPSVGMCDFGSAAKSLAASERKGEMDTFLVSQRMRNRETGHEGSASLTKDLDTESRLRQYREKFCDPRDNNDGLRYICNHNPESRQGGTGDNLGGPTPERYNKDIDYARTFEWPWTLNVNFTDTTPTAHEEEIVALATNLYGSELFFRPSQLNSTTDGTVLTPVRTIYQDARAVLAKRSVAETSFDAIMAMKAEGAPGSKEYLIGVLEELGVGQDEAEKMVASNGAADPSYFAQMEVLTKKAYQNPDFYTNLYDKPVNVERKGVAIQAIGLMQKFDLFKSHLRTESSLSVLLELAVETLQEDIENQINQQSEGGTAGVQ